MRPILLVLIALLPSLASGQHTPGFVPCNEPTESKSIVGIWLHDAVQTHGRYAGCHVWTQLELRTDGEAVENEMQLTSSVFLGLNSSAQILTFPTDFEIRTFLRQTAPVTAVEDLSWGELKARPR